VGGFVPKEPPRAFVPADLYEYMNGASPSFIEYGFRRLVVAEYVKAPKTDEAITVEVFDMGSPKGAFGKFSAERDPTYDHFALGVEGYAGGGNLVFWAQRYYVKVTGFEDNAEVAKLLRSFSESIAAKIGDPGKPLAVFSRFPFEGRRKNTERFIAKNFADIPGLPGGFSVDYKESGRELSVFLLDVTSEGAAKKALSQVQARFPRAKAEGADGDEVISVGGDEDALLFLRRKGEVAGIRGRLPHADAVKWAQRVFLRKSAGAPKATAPAAP
jgi:hypothetical protein